MRSKALAILGAALLGVAVAGGSAVADAPRPAAAGTGEVVAWVHLRGGEHLTFRAAGKQFPVQVGTPLLRSDTLEVPAGEFVVVKLRNGYVVKIDEDTTLSVAKIVSLDAPPTKESLTAQLDRVLTKEERGRAERIAGTQARLAGAESVAPQSSSAPAPEPTVQPTLPATPVARPKSAAPPRPLSRGLVQEEQEERRDEQPPRLAQREESARKPPQDALRSGGILSDLNKDKGGLGGLTGSSGNTEAGLSGLGLRGTGSGGGGTGVGIGGIGGIGKGSGSGYGSGSGHLGGRSGPSPVLKFGEVEVQGPLDKHLVAIIARHHQNELRLCYEKALQANPAVAGKLVLRLTLDTKGAVVSAQASGTISDPALGPCAAARAKQWLFPAPASADKKPSIAILTIPLDLAPTGP